MSSRERTFGLLTVSLTLLGWSSIPLFLRHFAESIDAFTSNGVRYGFAALLWLPALLWARARGTLPRGLMRAALLPSAFNCAGQVAFALAHYRTEPGLLTFGMRTQIVFVALGAAALFPAERKFLKSPPFLLGMGLVVLGSFGMIVLGGALRGATGEGFALAVLAGVMYAAYGLSVRRNMQGAPPILAFAAISQYTAAGMLVLMLLLGERMGLKVLDLPRKEIVLLLGSAVIGIALGHVFYYISIARLGVTVTAGVIQLQPFCVAAVSYFLFRERLSAPQWASGGVAVVGATVLLAVQSRMARAQREAEVDASADSRARVQDEPAGADARAEAEAPGDSPARA
ncbi:MAG: DMT family transporter [Polyangiaceae bacterium]